MTLAFHPEFLPLGEYCHSLPPVNPLQSDLLSQSHVPVEDRWENGKNKKRCVDFLCASKMKKNESKQSIMGKR